MGNIAQILQTVGLLGHGIRAWLLDHTQDGGLPNHHFDTLPLGDAATTSPFTETLAPDPPHSSTALEPGTEPSFLITNWMPRTVEPSVSSTNSKAPFSPDLSVRTQPLTVTTVPIAPVSLLSNSLTRTLPRSLLSYRRRRCLQSSLQGLDLARGPNNGVMALHGTVPAKHIRIRCPC